MTSTKIPLISIIVATYNRAYLVSQSIESVLNQTFKGCEIIVVDDASTDNTRELLNEKYGDQIIYIGKKKNEGLSSARNTGIRASRGEYLAFLDDDDAWLPEKLELQMDLMKEKPLLGLVYCGYYEVNRDGKVISEIKPTKRGYIFDDLLCRNYIAGSASAVLVKREVFAKTGYFDENLSSCEDWDMWIRVSKFYEIDFVSRPLVEYMIHDDNMSRIILNMEKSTFAVLNKYWTEISREKKYEERKNKLYSDHCISFAWRYYLEGDRKSFNRLIYQALEYSPLNTIFVHGEGARGKEEALFEVFHKYWNKPEHQEQRESRKWVFNRQYIQLAWEYYSMGDMKNFRRCLLQSFRNCPSGKVLVLLLKSLLGKRAMEEIHRLRIMLNERL